MKKAWKIFRAFILALIFVLIAVPVSLYIILSTEWAQNDIRRVAVSAARTDALSVRRDGCRHGIAMDE